MNENANGEKITFDEAFLRLSESAKAISNPDITLEDAIKNYRSGKEYYEICSKLLDEAKQIIQVFDREKNEMRGFDAD